MYLQKIENYQGEKMKTIHINSRQLKKYKKLYKNVVTYYKY